MLATSLLLAQLTLATTPAPQAQPAPTATPAAAPAPAPEADDNIYGWEDDAFVAQAERDLESLQRYANGLRGCRTRSARTWRSTTRSRTSPTRPSRSRRC